MPLYMNIIRTICLLFPLLQRPHSFENMNNICIMGFIIKACITSPLHVMHMMNVLSYMHDQADVCMIIYVCMHMQPVINNEN